MNIFDANTSVFQSAMDRSGLKMIDCLQSVRTRPENDFFQHRSDAMLLKKLVAAPYSFDFRFKKHS